jgi:hypothetical protein
MTNLLELADRVESGEGADRELELQIWRIFDPRASETEVPGRAPLPWLYCYTASLDAALKLVPEGCWAEGSLGRHDSTRSSIEIHAPMTYNPIGRAEASTPARALTAACLRARAEMVK